MAVFVYNIVLSSSKRCGCTICLLALGEGSTQLAEVSAKVTYDKTSGKRECTRPVDFEPRETYLGYIASGRV